jgi:hypothetical protein
MNTETKTRDISAILAIVATGDMSTLSKAEMKMAFEAMSKASGVKVRVSEAKPYEARSLKELVEVLAGQDGEDLGYHPISPEVRANLAKQLDRLVLGLSAIVKPGHKICIEFDSRGFGQARLKELWTNEKTGDKVKKVQVPSFEAIDGRKTENLYFGL